VLHREEAALKVIGALAHEEELAAWDRGSNATATGKRQGKRTARAAGRAPAPERAWHGQRRDKQA
jgi:hypothetical protein